MNMMYYELVS